MLSSTRKYFAFILIFALILATVSTALAQTSPSTFEITRIDQSNFPENTIYFYAYNVNGLPVPNLTKADIQVFEDQAPVEFEVSEEELGVRVVIVIDAGLGINATGSTGTSRYSEMKSFISNFLTKVGVTSSVLVATNENGQYRIISDFGNQADVINEQLENYVPNPGSYSNGISSISQAITELSNINDEKKEFIILLSPGLELQPDESFASYSELISTPGSPFIFTVLFRNEEGAISEKLVRAASIGKGQYLHYTPETKDNLDPFFGNITDWRYQYKVTYPIQNFTSGSHEISLTNTAQTIHTSTTYSLEVSEPVVTIIEPANNQALNQSSTEKLFTKVEITYPDSHPRKINTVVLSVDGKPITTLTDPGGSLLDIAWDSSLIDIAETTPMQLDVEITDELGFTSKSESIQITLNPEIRPTQVQKMSPLSLGLQIGALVLALAAVVLVIVFRRQIASAGGAVITKATDFIEILTKPRRDMTAKAHLEVLAGAESRGKIDVFGTTPIGRSRKYADLVFHAGEENSPVSNLHCTILDEEDAFLIRDEQSTWGTFLNHNRLSPLEKYRLQDGDEIDLAPIERGGIKLKFTMLASLYSSDEEFRPIPASNQAENITDDEDYSEDITTKPTRRPFLD